MVLQKQYNLRQWNNAMTDCISLVQLVRFLNQTIYKLEHCCGNPQNKSSFFFAITPFGSSVDRTNALHFFLKVFLFLQLSLYNFHSCGNMSPTTCLGTMRG